MHRKPALGLARTLTPTGLGLVGLLTLPLAAAAEGGAESGSPWTPPTLDVGVDLSAIQLPINSRPAPQPVVTTGDQVGPSFQPAAPTSADLDHDHDGDGVPDHAAADHPAADGGGLTIVEGDSHDFGPLIQGAVVDHTFLLESSGTAPLVVSSIKPSCGCTVATSERVRADGTTEPYTYGQELAPGERLRVTARLNTDGKKNRTQSTLTVFSNDTSGTTMLRLSADVQPFFTLEPNAYINFGKIFANEQKTERLTIKSPVADRFKLELDQAQALPEYLSVELSPVNADAEGRSDVWQVVATIGPGAPESPSQNWPLRLTSDTAIEGAPALPDGSQKKHAVTAYTVAQVVGLVSANPYYVSFGLVRPGQELPPRTVTIEIADDQFQASAMPITIRGRQESDTEIIAPRIQSSIAPIDGQPGKHLLTLTLGDLPDTFNGPFGGYVDIEVGHPTKPTLTIPFSGVVRNTEVRPAPPVPTPGGSAGN